MKTCSVIVPIYNAAPYLAQCLSSIRMQTYTDLQVILVNDGSSDCSADIARAFVQADARFMLLEQSNRGQAAARNRGLEQAMGEYLVFVDADDRLEADFVERHVAALGRYDYVQSGYRRVLTDGTVLEQKEPRYRYQFTSPCMRLYRTSCLRTHRLTFPEGMIYEDVIFSLHLWGTGVRGTLLKYVGYHYTFNPTSTTSSSHRADRHRLYRALWQSHATLWQKTLTFGRIILHFLREYEHHA